MANLISLQNTPDDPSITRSETRFRSEGDDLAGLVFAPSDAAAPLPAVVVTGAWTTVKEQMAGTYARELARRGFIALAFDFRGWGESEGRPRFVEDPASKTTDIGAAIRHLRTHPLVDPARVFGLGICASAGYMAKAAAHPGAVEALALVAPWLHTPEMAVSIYGGADSVAALRSVSAASLAMAEGRAIVAASTTDASAPMFNAPYYTEADRGMIDAYDNAFNELSWEPWLTYDALASAGEVAVPTLVVCSDDAALPAGARAFAEVVGGRLEELWIDGATQFDFYDRADIVQASADRVARHFGGER